VLAVKRAGRKSILVGDKEEGKEKGVEQLTKKIAN
jgi:hypothetical protein